MKNDCTLKPLDDVTVALLLCHDNLVRDCSACPYRDRPAPDCTVDLMKDAATYLSSYWGFLRSLDNLDDALRIDPDNGEV